MKNLNIDNIKQMVKDGNIRWTNHVIGVKIDFGHESVEMI